MITKSLVKIDAQNTMVVDLTYVCNATCKYCRWGNKETDGIRHMKTESLLVPDESLRTLRTNRIVFSGGEPRLHPEIEKIIAYYKDRVNDVILISNGYGLKTDEANHLLKLGVTGFTFSIDSLDPKEENESRNTPPKIFRDLLRTVRSLSVPPREFEIGINTVVSHVNAKWSSVKALVEFAEKYELDFIKFSPIFDDGYVGRNARHMMLSRNDAENLSIIADKISNLEFKRTNKRDFWLDLSDMARGIHFTGQTCGLGPDRSNSIGGNLTMCYWVRKASYGKAMETITDPHAIEIQQFLAKEKERCAVDFHCFCNQKVGHTWRTKTQVRTTGLTS